MRVVIDLQEEKYYGDAESCLSAAITEVPQIAARI